MFNHLTHILLDASRMGEQIDEAKERNSSYDSLYRGSSEESLAAAAPYLFQFAYPGPFSEWYLETGWGDAWGVLFKSSRPMQELHKHFRKFLLINTEEGQELYFRFYDPRVLRIVLPACNAGQIRGFFGPVDYFLMEDEDPAFALRFRHENGILMQEQIGLEDIQRTTSSLSREIPESVILTSEAPINVRSASQDTIVTPAPKEPQTGSKPKSKWNMFD